MIVSKTPLRVSFFGGGSDLPHFYNQYDGLCVSSSISEYIALVVNKCDTKHIRLMYSDIEIVKNLNDLKHDRARESLRLCEIYRNIEIASFANIPTKGTGLGSSSSFTVGLLNALRHEDNQHGTSAWDLAEDACNVEINMCKQPIGKQDQYAAAFGGLNAYEFSSYGVNIRPVHMTSQRRQQLQDSLMFFSTNKTRNASTLLANQVQENNTDDVRQLVEMAKFSIKIMERGNINDLGDLLHQSWLCKKKTNSMISSDDIDTMYEHGRNAGALGGKLLGAGGGGYMMFFVTPRAKAEVRLWMGKLGYNELMVKLTDKGSTVQVIS